jgi:hypothetical protein
MQHYFADCEMWILISISKFDRGKHSSSGVNHPPNRYTANWILFYNILVTCIIYLFCFLKATVN